MNPHDQLDLLVRDTLAGRADDAPAAAPVIDRVLTDGAPRRSRGRLPLVAAGIAASVAAGAFGAATLWPEESPTRVATQPGTGSGPGGGVLERCLDLGADALPAAHWGAGSRVLTSAAAGGASRAVLVSADGSQWADCTLAGDGEGHVLTYPMEPARQGATEFGHYGDADGAATSFSMLERFPENVAEVRLRFASGAELTAEAVDGFVVFQVDDADLDLGELESLHQYDRAGRLVGAPGMAPGDADLPLGQRSLVPAQPLDSVERYDDQ